MTKPLHHLALIPDGNRTRAQDQWLSAMEGHLAGQQNAVDLIKRTFSHTDIQVITIRWLSTENTTNRSQEELDYLSHIYKLAIGEMVDFLREAEINFERAGNRDGLSDDLLEVLDQTQTELTFATDKTVVVCINYGGRDEILRGVQAWVEAGSDPDQLTAEQFGTFLDFWNLPPVDLVVRTKGDIAHRLSGFMSWRVGYAELYFTDRKFPDFTVDELQKAIDRYYSIEKRRNFGK